MKSAAAFFNSFLVKDAATGKLVSTPSNSPEHGGLVAGPTMDHQIIRELYKNCIAAAGVLKTDADSCVRWQQQYDAIAPNTIGRYGQLQEWMKDVDDTSDTHRHVSHLWGVYPGTDITWQTPELMKAARQSLLYRGDGGTGWSLAWKVNLWARFLEGDHALLMLSNLLAPAEINGREQGGVYVNLMDAHPPFQIDGNFGGAAGLAEMLVQSQAEGIVLLPALPNALQEGRVTGIKARGGFVLQLVWRQHRLQKVVVTSLAGKPCKLIYNGKEKTLTTKAGQEYVIEGW
jgi:alpha-L-fucosidase 2